MDEEEEEDEAEAEEEPPKVELTPEDQEKKSHRFKASKDKCSKLPHNTR